MEQSYDNTFASIDAAAAILQILSRPDPLDEEPEVEGLDEIHLGDEVESEDQPPPAELSHSHPTQPCWSKQLEEG